MVTGWEAGGMSMSHKYRECDIPPTYYENGDPVPGTQGGAAHQLAVSRHSLLRIRLVAAPTNKEMSFERMAERRIA